MRVRKHRATKNRATEHRATKHRATKHRATEHRATEHRATKHRATGRLIAAAAALAALTTVAATAPASASSTPGVTAKTITIGATVPLTGPAAPGYDEIAPAMNAVFAWVNAHGGIYGRKIRYIYKDDQYNPADTATLTRQLVLQDDIFADVGSLGTPTQSAVQGFLNAEKVPQLFIESGCDCWSNPKYPWSFGWEPPYTVEGKILGTYIAQHFAGKKVGYLTQDDEFGQDFVKGLDMEIPSADIVSQQTYDASTLSGVLSDQVAALKAAGAQVVALATIPAATALAMLPAAELSYFPQYVISTVGADSPTVGPLLESFTKSAGGSSTEAQESAALLNGAITDAYLPPESQTSNPWVKTFNKLLKSYAPATYKRYGLDGNTEYGLALAYTFVQALHAAGKDLTRAGLVAAIEKDGKSFVTPGFVPLSYSKSVHYGFQGAEIVQLSSSAPPAVTPTGRWIGSKIIGKVQVTNVGSAGVKTYTGKIVHPPKTLSSTA